ncbi:MAG TPA: Cj0069 family protein [Phenylobacterium sp.]|uniref:Cj0069 family protein n=1 Tax=Phenylobacterium sp. TaxID=1871053 RepID=UPI002BCEC50D|nr:Cj0069 family protein [Phenylobacterium sp.]HXA38784.1 Cj0069 family protein [Phenylobacterium sp.]
MSETKLFKVAVVWRGDRQARDEARGETSRLNAVFAALERQGIAAEPAVWSEDLADEVRAQLLGMDGVLVWVDPISTANGARRAMLDEILREVASAGVFVSAHPDVASKMGVKSVLHATRDLGWGTDTAFYETRDAFERAFPGRLSAGPRVLKQNRGNGGIGVWKVERESGGDVRVQEAKGGSEPRTLPLEAFMAERAADFTAGGGLVDQPFQPRHLEGMVRCYMSGGRVAGFGRQLVRALAPPEAGPAGPRLYSGPNDARFQRLRALMEGDWTPGLARRLGIAPDDLPVIWDADLLLGPRTPQGDDSYVLCEINVSSVFPIPDEAPQALAETTRKRLTAARRPRRLETPTLSNGETP